MTKPTSEKFGLSDSDYLSFKSFPKLVEKRFYLIGAILGGIVSIFLSYKNFSLLDTLYHLLAGWILGSISFGFLYKFLGHFLLKRHKLYLNVSNYEAALLFYQRTQENYWKSLKGARFEKELCNLFTFYGYSTELTSSTGDQGIDIFLRKGGITTIVQCKAHSKPVGPAIVRELYGVLVASKCSSAILASTSGFTKGAFIFVAGKRIQLLSLKDIIRMSEEIQASASPPNLISS